MVKFDEQHYLFLYEDVKKSKFAALEHWLVWGKYEARQAKFLRPTYLDLHSTIETEKEKVSVILSVQDKNKVNQARFKGAISSILNQSYKNFELIFVGSKDLIEPHDKIKVFETYEWQPAKRYNKGILESSGEFVALMFENCEWQPDCLEILISNIKDCMLVSAKVVFADEEFGERLTSRCYSYVTLPNNAVLMRKSLLESIGYFDESNELIKAEDLEMWARIHYNNKKTKFVPRVVGIQHEDNPVEVMHVDKKLAYANLVLRYDCFNEKYYMDNNPDVRGAVDSRLFHSGLDHFLNYGHKESRLICDPSVGRVKLL